MSHRWTAGALFLLLGASHAWGRPSASAQGTAEAPASAATEGPTGAATDASAVASAEEPVTRRLWVGATIHLSAFGDLLDRSTLLPRFGYGVRGGARFGRWGVFGLIERDHWVLSELDVRYATGVLNLAVGAELLYADERMSASVAVGASILLRDQALDDRGTTGVYVALRPVGLRYPVLRNATVQVDLLSFVVEAPVVRFPVLVEIQYRASITLEYGR